MGILFKSSIHFFILICLGGCLSNNADLGRVSTRPPFIHQLGSVTKFVPGANVGNDNCEDVLIDHYENIICVGSSSDILGEAPALPGVLDTVVVKMDRTGKLLWVFQLGAETSIGDNSGTDSCSGLALDRQGNIYCAGDASSFLTTPIRGPGGGTDATVLKLNSHGELQWIRQFGSVGNERCVALTIGKSGNLYCAGESSGSIGMRIDGSGLFETNGGSSDAFIAKFSPAGDLLWITQTGNNSEPIWEDGSTIGDVTNYDSCRAVVTDATETYVYCAGETMGSYGEPNITVPLDTDIMFLRLRASDGKDPRSIQFGLFTNNGPFNHDGTDTCRSMTIDKSGNLYCVGFTNGSIADTGAGNDAVIAKVNSGFTKGPIWQYGSTKWTLGSSAGNDDARVIKVDNENNLVVSGSTDGSFGETSGGGADFWVAKFTTTGTPLWITHFGLITLGASAGGAESNFGLALDTSQNIYAAGGTSGDLGEPAEAAQDIFILRLRPDGSL